VKLPGGIPLRIQPGFFLVTLLLGLGRPTLFPMASWLIVCLVSVIVHECGHAYVALAFGYRPSVLLWGGGGLTSFARPGERVPARTDVVVSLAGPMAGFAFGGLAILAAHLWPAMDPHTALVYDDLQWVNLGWGAVNLLPIIPLDGSHLALRALERLHPAGAVRDLLIFSVALCALGGAAALFWMHWTLGGLYALWLASPALRALTERREPRRVVVAATSSATPNPTATANPTPTATRTATLTPTANPLPVDIVTGKPPTQTR